MLQVSAKDWKVVVYGKQTVRWFEMDIYATIRSYE